MRCLIQRVSHASVTIDGKITGKIGRGLLIFAGFHGSDTEEKVAWMAEKIVKLRIFPDADGKMNVSVSDTLGSLLVVSQFTLYGDAGKGTRPSFIESARPEVAIPLYNRFVAFLKSMNPDVQTGEFGAMMEVELVNDGPVTIWLER